jgi:hypothetical protein
MYLFAPCYFVVLCFITLLCFATLLPRLVLAPTSFFWFLKHGIRGLGCWRFNVAGLEFGRKFGSDKFQVGGD